MNKRLWIAGLLGAVAMFVWSAIAHMALPLGEAGVNQIAQEQALLSTMQSSISAPGFYIFPGMARGTSQAEYQKKIATGPSGIMVYLPARDFSFGRSLAGEFATELAQALILAWLLSTTGFTTFAGRFTFCAVAGLMATIATNVSYWNWYSFPTTYTLGVMCIGWVGYLCAGLAAAWMKVGGQGRS